MAASDPRSLLEAHTCTAAGMPIAGLRRARSIAAPDVWSLRAALVDRPKPGLAMPVYAAAIPARMSPEALKLSGAQPPSSPPRLVVGNVVAVDSSGCAVWGVVTRTTPIVTVWLFSCGYEVEVDPSSCAHLPRGPGLPAKDALVLHTLKLGEAGATPDLRKCAVGLAMSALGTDWDRSRRSRNMSAWANAVPGSSAVTPEHRDAEERELELTEEWARKSGKLPDAVAKLLQDDEYHQAWQAMWSKVPSGSANAAAGELGGATRRPPKREWSMQASEGIPEAPSVPSNRPDTTAGDGDAYIALAVLADVISPVYIPGRVMRWDVAMYVAHRADESTLPLLPSRALNAAPDGSIAGYHAPPTSSDVPRLKAAIVESACAAFRALATLQGVDVGVVRAWANDAINQWTPRRRQALVAGGASGTALRHARGLRDVLRTPGVTSHPGWPAMGYRLHRVRDIAQLPGWAPAGWRHQELADMTSSAAQGTARLRAAASAASRRGMSRQSDHRMGHAGYCRSAGPPVSMARAVPAPRASANPLPWRMEDAQADIAPRHKARAPILFRSEVTNSAALVSVLPATRLAHFVSLAAAVHGRPGVWCACPDSLPELVDLAQEQAARNHAALGLVLWAVGEAGKARVVAVWVAEAWWMAPEVGTTAWTRRADHDVGIPPGCIAVTGIFGEQQGRVM